MPPSALPAHLLALVWRAMVVWFGHMSGRFFQVSHGEGITVGAMETDVLDAEGQLEAEMTWGWWCSLVLPGISEAGEQGQLGGISHFLNPWRGKGETFSKRKQAFVGKLRASIVLILLQEAKEDCTHANRILYLETQKYNNPNFYVFIAEGLMLVNYLFALFVFQCSCSTCCTAGWPYKNLLWVRSWSSSKLSCNTEFACYHSQNADAQFLLSSHHTGILCNSLAR